MPKVLFVCLGNICRSPTAQGVFMKLVEEQGLAHVVAADSAGTHAYHVGEPPDPRAQEAARKRGIDLSPQRARQVVERDFETFDYLVAMDTENLAFLCSLCSPRQEGKVRLLMEFAPGSGLRDVPDPYYGARNGFERVLDLVEEAAGGLIGHLRAAHRL
ncbi:MAG: low molecular weight phosphotyrosine protein phosphatase [Gammaproteobacteria bacterium]|nr:low molecular weight phosphotyrosine protein phosphatase [Gammaproteobacteria bacterium]NIR96689.1 low molecular weight phosphotyrosine protein phosphatase [Gammaproteobacteria bacterium]NIT62393.1 low molecular weight phosphotyrosine protein phosphatase [Gammaproteobacteria bacterium]NIV19325.1 low molecular weight phosphotyrosine protein phosphatase [Gammaproteobacteria bacterium]NIX10286.1 low molecular weight phosphotyrosine protein phosphatase [Gammaproteobacteria bacterium]